MSATKILAEILATINFMIGLPFFWLTIIAAALVSAAKGIWQITIAAWINRKNAPFWRVVNAGLQK